MMRILPNSDTEWVNLALAPFKAYPVVVFVITSIWSRELRGDPMIVFMVLGYAACFIGIAGTALAQTALRRREAASANWFWGFGVLVLALVFALRWLPTLAE